MKGKFSVTVQRHKRKISGGEGAAHTSTRMTWMTVNSHCRLVVFIYLLYTPAGLHEESRDGRGGREADGILRVITSCVKKKVDSKKRRHMHHQMRRWDDELTAIGKVEFVTAGWRC